MEEIKNPFSFGTGDIDKDLWLRDIDNEQEDFITRYGSATNKHRTALLRQAFQDLRARIANGDMLNRTADGQYQFGSALNRDDKHMQEAYQRALGFMGDLARRQIKAPTPLEEKKYGTTTLQQNWLKYLNPSGKFNEKSYWAEGDDNSRIADIKKFLEQEKNGLGAYSGFEGYKNRADLEGRIQAFLDNPTEKNLQRLGFDNRNWITKPVEEVPEESQKNELEQIQEQIAAQQEAKKVKQGRQYLNWENNRGNAQSWEFQTKPYDYQGMFEYNRNNGSIKVPDYSGRPTSFGNFSFSNFGGNKEVERTNQLRQAFDQKNIDLMAGYLKDLGVNYKTMATDNSGRLGAMLGLLQTQVNMGDKTASPYSSQLSRYLTPMQNGAYLINGSANKSTGRYAFYTPNQIGTYAPGIHEVSILDFDDPIARQALGVISSNKEGGKIGVYQNGGTMSDEDWYNYLNKEQSVKQETPKVQQEENEPSFQLSKAENARIAATIADITSMGTAFVPGYGTAISAVLGLGSTATNFGVDLADGTGLWNATKNAGFGLAADVMGLIPGLGGIGKGAKIARNLMWAVPKMMQWVNTANGLANAGEIKNSIMKLTSPSSMSVQDWQNVSQALQIMTGHGRSIATKVKKAGMTKTTTTTEPEYYVYTNKGKQKVTAEQFKKIRETRGSANRQSVTEQELGEGVTLNQTRFAPWNTSTRFGAFKEVPGRTTIEVQNKHKGWFSDENLVQKAENANPSVDIRGILTRINPYRAYYSGRNQPVVPKRDYSRLSIFPADSPLNIHNTTSKVQPYPTGEKYAARPTEQPKAQPNPQSKKKHKRRKHEIGGTLKALRNGGIIKAAKGVQLSPNAGTWYNDVFSNYRDRIINQLNQENPQDSVQWLNNMQSSHANIYKAAGNNFYNTAYQSNDVKSYQQEYDLGGGFFEKGFQHGFNDPGIAPGYANRYVMDGERLSGDKPEVFKADGLYSAITDDRRLLGRRTGTSDDWTPEDLNAFNDSIKKSGYKLQLDPADNYYKLVPFSSNGAPESTQTPKQSNQNEDNVKDKLSGIKTPLTEKLKDPFDPTLLTIAGKTLLGLRGNKDIYGNLLKEMPQAPLRDPIARQLAIVGWQERIKQGQNQLADLRRVQQIQQGSDQQTNFATALETERTGRDIMDKAFVEDSGRQFETAGKLWNLKNEDTMYNIGVGDANRKAIADRARMMAQIRAAWRSGDNNILMGGFADASNWLLKKYQREQDLVDKAKEIQLGSPEERAQSDLYENDSKYVALMDKYQSGQTLTDEERAYVRSAQAKALRNIRGNYAQTYYNMYHTPWFGGGYKETIVAKDGTKLEVAKLKARGRDNDRYVSMIKDLRPSRRRRRR